MFCVQVIGRTATGASDGLLLPRVRFCGPHPLCSGERGVLPGAGGGHRVRNWEAWGASRLGKLRDLGFNQPLLAGCPWASHFTSLGLHFPPGKLDQFYVALTFFCGFLRPEDSLSKASKEPCDREGPFSWALWSSL